MEEKGPSVLFGDADLEWTKPLRAKLRADGVRVAASSDPRELLSLAERQSPDVIVLDDQLETVGRDVIASLLRQHSPRARVILLLPEGSHPERDDHRHLEPVCCLVRPVTDRDLEAVIGAALKDTAVPGRAPRPPVILCVDDDEIFLKSLARILRRQGYAVVAYDNPEQALEAIPFLDPALVFIDVLMPGMNGLDLASELREKYGNARPLVLLSAKSSDREIAEGYKSGASFYITKPCEPQAVLEIAQRFAGRPLEGTPR